MGHNNVWCEPRLRECGTQSRKTLCVEDREFRWFEIGVNAVRYVARPGIAEHINAWNKLLSLCFCLNIFSGRGVDNLPPAFGQKPGNSSKLGREVFVYKQNARHRLPIPDKLERNS